MFTIMYPSLCTAKYTVDSDEDSDTLKPISRETYESEEQYDSDRDPVWTPFEIVSLDLLSYLP